uniref:Uncharacterized protein n=1 Tax=Romanomermis culicivorax TaxID=13658 RepID=A0A915L381_ROMCU
MYIYQMWFILQRIQKSFSLSERLIRVIRRSTPQMTPFTLLGDGRFISDTIENLIAEGVDVNCSSGDLLPLHCACHVGDILCVKILLRNGAKANLRDGYNRTALHYAAEKCASCVGLLLNYDADVNKQDGDGRSPLHYAAWKNKSLCALRLLEAGADPNASDSRLDTPLCYAASKGKFNDAI